MNPNRPRSEAWEEGDGPVCVQGSVRRPPEGKIWGGGCQVHPLASALGVVLLGGSSSEREFGLWLPLGTGRGDGCAIQYKRRGPVPQFCKHCFSPKGQGASIVVRWQYRQCGAFSVRSPQLSAVHMCIKCRACLRWVGQLSVTLTRLLPVSCGILEVLGSNGCCASAWQTGRVCVHVCRLLFYIFNEHLLCAIARCSWGPKTIRTAASGSWAAS